MDILSEVIAIKYLRYFIALFVILFFLNVCLFICTVFYKFIFKRPINTKVKYIQDRLYRFTTCSLAYLIGIVAIYKMIEEIYNIFFT